MTVNALARRYFAVFLPLSALPMLPTGCVPAQLQPVDIDIDINGGQTHRLADVRLTIEPLAKEGSVAESISLTGPGQVLLSEGRYTMRVQLDQWTEENLFSVNGPTSQTVVLDVGFATLALIPQIGANAYRHNVAWRVFSWRKDRNGKRKLLAAPAGVRPRITLPEGFYTVEAIHGGKATRHTIEINRGRTYDYTLVKH
ncbi:MAG: hypothetical protein GDA47_03330 [Rhodospirillales bacterium]|nr:hypothetical protein [Rhodospirillales bacterium]